MSVTRDRAVGRIAAMQRTLVTTAQLAACGLGKDAVAHRVKSGRLHPEFRGVYSLGCGELPPLGREQAALLACGEHAFLSHASAAWIWGLLEAAPDVVEVSVVARQCASRKGIRVHRIQNIDRREVRRHEGLWVSTPARAVLEIAATLSISEVEWSIEEGLAKRALTPRALEEVLARNRPCRGATRVAAILGDDTATEMIRSRAEKQFLRLIRDARLPRPVVNRRRGRSEPDFLWPEHRLVVEIDSYSFHGGPLAFQADREKDLVRRDEGLDVMRFTARHVNREGVAVLARVAAELARRAPRD